jgi:hypothetical protein
VRNAPAHDWAAAVGTALTPGAALTGANFRGPQSRATICPVSGPGTRKAPERCDDTAYGRGRGGRLSYEITVPAGGETSVWFGVAGSEAGPEEAKATLASMLRDPAGALAAKVAERERIAGATRLSLPGDPLLAEGIEWSKQNLADSVQDVRDLELREVNAGKRYPPARRTLPEARFLGAGFPDYPWLFATDGEYTAFASVVLGQFEPIKDHLRALRDASRVINGGSGKVVHEVITEGSVYFGALRDPGNTDETSKFPSAVALLWRWTGDDDFLREMYSFTRRTCASSSTASTRTATAGPRGSGTSSARAWARRSSTTPRTRSAACSTSPTWPAPAATSAPAAGPSGWATGCARASTRRGGTPRPRLRRLARAARQRALLPAPLDRRDARWRSSSPSTGARSRAWPAPPALSTLRTTSARATPTRAGCSTRAGPAATGRRARRPSCRRSR